MTETVYFWGCCGTEIGPSVVVETWPDGTPRAWETRCGCGKGVMTQIDGGTLDLGLVRDEPAVAANDYEVFP